MNKINQIIKNKKALQYQVLVGIIITLLILVIILGFYKTLGDVTYSTIKQEQCKNSVRANAKRLVVLGEDITNTLGERVPLQCETTYIKVEKGKENQTLAKEMATCWDMFLEGKQEIFATEDQSYCVVCSVLKFDDDVKQLNGFTTYLMSNTVPWNNSLFYYNYLTKTSYDEAGLQSYDKERLAQYDKLNVENPLAVVFFMGKDAYPLTTLGYEGSKVSGALSGAAVGVVGAVGLFATGFFTFGTTWVAGAAIITTGFVGGASYGYVIGSSESAYWDSGILLHDYSKFNELQCSYMEGKATGLEVRDRDEAIDFSQVRFK